MLFKNARIKNASELSDFRVLDGKFTQIGTGLAADEGEEVIDLSGRLVLPPFIESHVHLDTCLTAGDPVWNMSGTLFEGIECWAKRKDKLTVEDVKNRARKAVEMTAARGLETGAHFILGLPGETPQMLLDQCSAINALPLTSVKFHQLQLIKGTAMEKEFEKCPEDFWRPGLDEYLELIVDILERLRPDLCIERIAGEVPPRFVRETPWGLVRNFQILKMLEARLESRDTFQSRLFK